MIILFKENSILEYKKIKQLKKKLGVLRVGRMSQVLLGLKG
jgi:hypothetical protein